MTRHAPEPGKAVAPCDGCDHRIKCAAKSLICPSFVRYVDGSLSWRSFPRRPSLKVTRRVEASTAARSAREVEEDVVAARKAARREYEKAWRLAHPEAIKAARKRWADRNPEWVRKYRREWMRAHPETRTANKQWRLENRDRLLAEGRRRYAEAKVARQRAEPRAFRGAPTMALPPPFEQRTPP